MTRLLKRYVVGGYKDYRFDIPKSPLLRGTLNVILHLIRGNLNPVPPLLAGGAKHLNS